ncbi:uncharacterized protein PpBr36_09145 [Pyricularia pennisetigena]|uniref:uncharacterized protein n=1 Tax=Pyricularia pennisetigena TaxID=1578925 RepID=UPI00114EB552|nr:uncharacterized protein PpBr36_09145 [Pyricularia pennisetigena]TLS21942.1 hypothetical protein PpBr36_09145 [Pyricularia pennisetigena]
MDDFRNAADDQTWPPSIHPRRLHLDAKSTIALISDLIPPLAVLHHRVSRRNPPLMENEAGRLFFRSLGPLDKLLNVTAGAFVPVGTNMFVRSVEKLVSLKAGKSEFSAVF